MFGILTATRVHNADAYVDEGHYIENTGNTTLKFLEIFNAPKFEDVALAQWLALTPPALVKQQLQVSDATIASFNKTKQVVVGPKA